LSVSASASASSPYVADAIVADGINDIERIGGSFASLTSFQVMGNVDAPGGGKQALAIDAVMVELGLSSVVGSIHAPGDSAAGDRDTGRSSPVRVSREARIEPGNWRQMKPEAYRRSVRNVSKKFTFLAHSENPIPVRSAYCGP
jgi:hypothetical protein